MELNISKSKKLVFKISIANVDVTQVRGTFVLFLDSLKDWIRLIQLQHQNLVVANRTWSTIFKAVTTRRNYMTWLVIIILRFFFMEKKWLNLSDWKLARKMC